MSTLRLGLGPMNESRARLGLAPRLLAVAILVAFATSCATTGATLGSGVGDRYLDEPPYYAGNADLIDHQRVAHLPIEYQRGATQEDFFDPQEGTGTSIDLLLDEMNEYLDGLMGGVALDPRIAATATPPDVRFGCDKPFGFDCEEAEADLGARGHPWLLLAVGRPSRDWVTAVAEAMDETTRDHALMITLEVGEYWTNQKNLLGSKEVRLGTGHSQDVPWLTSLDQPVQVLQLTGALMREDGKAVAIGAEGLLAQRTNIILSGFGMQALIDEEAVERLRTMRRTDLRGEPLVWQVALTNLVAELTGRPQLARY